MKSRTDSGELREKINLYFDHALNEQTFEQRTPKDCKIQIEECELQIANCKFQLDELAGVLVTSTPAHQHTSIPHLLFSPTK